MGFIIAAIVASWMLAGIVHLRFFNDGRAGGWLIMITDRRNTNATWMAIPALVITWMLWPFAEEVARRLFLTSRYL